MTIGDFFLGTLRLAAIVLPVLLAALQLRRAYFRVSGAVALLAQAVISLSLLLLGAEALGLVSLLRPAPLIALFVLIAIATRLLLRQSRSERSGPAQRGTATLGLGDLRDRVTASAALAVLVVAGQWCLRTANSLGGGMLSFDTLWYHMPFAARFAQTGSVTGIHFTQADPYTAYYPANAELLHGLGILAMHGDFLSPLLNLAWLTIALLAAWLVGRPWRVERHTLCAGCLVLALPVLAGTQPGEGFNDVAGLAMLFAGVALLVNAPGEPLMLAVVGLALGWSVGTKVTFIVPALMLGMAVPLQAPRGARARVLALLGVPLALTGSWWYLRNVLVVGNPFGLRLDLGPVVLDGPVSPLANSQQGTVISNLQHFSLWISRFAPGLFHALGPVWPLVLALCVAGIAAGIARRAEPVVRILALTGSAAGFSYFFLPTSASGIQHGSELFEVNLRYATPAIAFGLLLVPILLRSRRPSWVPRVAPAFTALIVLTQLAPSLWLSQTPRHALFLLAVTCLGGGLIRALSLRSPRKVAVVSAVALLAGAGLTYLVERHYFDRRYLTGDSKNEGGRGIGIIYRWAQGVAHQRIALYGVLPHYPLYGAHDTNSVDYLGFKTPDGGFRRIASCASWRETVGSGHYRYLVLTGAPTGTIPAMWTQDDPAATLLLHPARDEFVFGLSEPLNPRACP